LPESQATPWNLGVLLSGAGRTLENLLDVIDRGDLDASVRVVVSSVPNVRGLDVAAAAGVPHLVIRRGAYESLHDYSEAMCDAMVDHGVDLVVMAGFLRKMLVYPDWEGRIINIHPCLLPDAGHYAAGKGMFGEKVHAAVIAHGDTISGATVHLVTNDYDEGPPLARVTVPVLSDDTPITLGTRVFQAEKVLYPDTIRTYMNDFPHLRRRCQSNPVPGNHPT
jgi:formyltetrahydrofolate-dependent phosphoribosylglycinamide formyltransferase